MSLNRVVYRDDERAVIEVRNGEEMPMQFDGYMGGWDLAATYGWGLTRGSKWMQGYTKSGNYLYDKTPLYIAIPIVLLKPEFNEWGEVGL